ncbi:hypothetical protein N7495_007441 [Penicillium taxi]|uniref:uncharacterized protein n=1 Tax=Penicillium taxi TaxID=168475 RepID=UPI0025458978|nr:uncharacterized protein N7495_007441 [Penicillium taxi]KAJ5887400.1 hypothetical protein N7495_007441 [Penicillium taxi]
MCTSASPRRTGKTLKEVAEVFTTPGMRLWKMTIKRREVQILEHGVILSEKTPDLHTETGMPRHFPAASHHYD